MLQLQKATYTPEEYFALEERAEYKSEYYDGKLFAMAGCTPNHNQIVVNMIVAFETALRQTPCRVLTSDVRIQIDKRRHYAYPDLSVVCGTLEFAEDRRDMIANPLTIVEVLSESTRDYDRGSKFAAYRNITTLREYLLIDQDTVHVEYFHKDDNGRWVLEEYKDMDDVVTMDSLHLTLALQTIYARIERNNRKEQS